MCQIAFSIPDEVLFDIRMTPADATSFARRMTALGLYEHGGVSLGYCSQIAGMHVEDFMRFLGEHKVSVFHFDSEEEFLQEVANA